jgi:uncharacterized cofD-like protein
VLQGEAAIDVRTEHRDAEIDFVYLSHPAYPTQAAIQALRSADLVVIGPGDLYTSLIPNLLVDGIVDAIAAARYRAYVVNLMTKPGESDNFKASTFVDRLLEYLSPGQLDAVVVNTARPSAKVLERYAREGAAPVEVDTEALRDRGMDIVAEPLLVARHLVRHDPTALSDALLNWLDSRIHLERGAALASTRARGA